MSLIINKIENNCQCGIWHINEDVFTLKETLHCPDKIPQMKNELRLKQWLAARNILQIISPDEPVLTDKNGKPHFVNGDKYLSFSHCQDMAATVISEKKCGIDLEFYSDKAQRISARFLSDSEKKVCHDRNDFTYFWMAKEAVYKAFGENEITFSRDIQVNPVCFDEKNEAQAIGLIEKGEKKEEYRLFFKRTTTFAYCIAVEK